MKKLIFYLLFGFGFLLWGCSPGDDDVNHDDAGQEEDTSSNEDVEITCEPDKITCKGIEANYCNSDGNGWEKTVTCSGETPICYNGLGCVKCEPGKGSCSSNNEALKCNDDGNDYTVVEQCDETESCVVGICVNPCEQAAEDKSYEGCEYWAVTLMNEVAYDFVPAIVVSNRNAQSATVTVTRGGQEVASVVVEPELTATIEIPWVMDLKTGGEGFQSVNISDGAYHIQSTLPITVYQFNPLRYKIDSDCSDPDAQGDEIGDNVCNSYSNDASLLLPVQVLTNHYIVMSWPEMGHKVHVVPLFGNPEDQYSFTPSIIGIINPGTENVEVEIKFSAPTQAGTDLEEYNAGESGVFTIAPGGVLQLATKLIDTCNPDYTEPESVACAGGMAECTYGYCEMTEYDFTGTEITSSAPVSVFGGHDCSFVPFNKWACDHLEEQLFPYETWGTHFVASQSFRENNEPDVWRILSGADENLITFTPSSIHDPVTLNKGQFITFEAVGSFEINATEDKPILVGQFIVGQNYNAFTGQDLPPGDPSFSLAVPVEQYRKTYNFLAPDTYDRSFVNITTTQEGVSTIFLDGTNLANSPWEPIDGTNYMVLKYEFHPGSHSLTSEEETFGIIVYGYGQYTSYMFPGGLDLNEISIW